MASRVTETGAIGNFKRSRADRLKEKTRDKHDDREGNSSAHLALIRQLPCCVCGKRPGGQAHHLKATGLRGAGMRSPDKCALPMCEECHLNGVERAGSKNELDWFAKRGIQALDYAAALWTATGDLGRMFKVALEHMAGKK